MDDARTNIEPVTTRFVGRRQELKQLGTLCQASGRPLLLLGTAGVGKSRLAAQAALAWMQDNPQAHALFCDLASTGTLDAALRRIGQTLGLSFGPSENTGQVIERIGDALSSRADLFLVLDDAELVVDQLLEPIERWQKAAASARFVVTTRRDVPARIPVQRFELEPLSAEDALELLADRARRVRSDFVLIDRHRSAVLELIERLDRLPLALELIAPRLRLLSPPQLLERFESARDPQGALNAALQRSWELLHPWERDALAQTAVFRDGFYLDAAEAVIDLGAHAEAPDILTVLEGLVAQSLLRTTTVAEFPDEVRIKHFAAVQQFARGKLSDPAGVFARHARYYLDKGEQWDRGVETALEVQCTHRLLVELPNLQAASERSDQDPEALARFGLILHFAYQRSGPFTGQARLVKQVIEAAQSLADKALSARALLARARVKRWANDLTASMSDLEEALQLCVAAGDVITEAACQRNMAANLFRTGQIDDAGACIDRALQEASRSGQLSDEINARNMLGYLLTLRGDFDGAEQELERALGSAHRLGTPGLIAIVTSSLAELMLRRDRLDQAERYSDETIRQYESLHYIRQLTVELLNRGTIRCLAGKQGARQDAERALDMARRMGLRAAGVRALQLQALIAFYERDFFRAQELIARALQGARDVQKARLLLYHGAARGMLGQTGQARKAFRQARAIKAKGHGELGAILSLFARLGDRDPKADRTDIRSAAEAALKSRDPEVRRAAELLIGCMYEERSPRKTETAVQLEISEDWRRFRLPPRAPVDLTRRRALRAVLRCLVQQHLSHPGKPLGLQAVLDAGWPGEQMGGDSGARRVYVTINRLRKLGLGDLVLTMGDGYMLATRVQIIRAGQ